MWTDRKISDLLMALFDGRPVGTMLLIDRFTEAPIHGSRVGQPFERFSARSLAGTDTDLTNCTELILDGQQRLTSLWRAFELGTDTGLTDTEPHERHAFVKVESLREKVLLAADVVWPRKTEARLYINDPVRASADDLIPLRLFDPRNADSKVDFQVDPLFLWCGDVCNNKMAEGVDLWTRISHQIRSTLLERNIWYAKLPPTMERRDAIEVFIKVNESSAVIKKFDIAVAELDSLGGTQTSLRQKISDWAERNTHSERFFGPDEEKMIPKVGELILKIACLQEEMTPTDSNYIAPKVLKRLDDEKMFRAILEGIEWTFDFLDEERIWKAKHLPSAVPLRVLPALFPEICLLADSSDSEGVTRRYLRAYLWRAFVTDRYKRSANTRLHRDFVGLRRVFRRLGESDDPRGELAQNVPIFRRAVGLPTLRELSDLAEPLAAPTKTDSLSRSLLVVSLQHGARDFASGTKVSASNVGGREAHHLFPKGYLKESFTDLRQINHCLNFALVSGPTNKRIAAKAPVEYLTDRYKTDSGLAEAELRGRVESHLIPFDALAVRERQPGKAYRVFLKERAKMFVPAIERLAEGQPI